MTRRKKPQQDTNNLSRVFLNIRDCDLGGKENETVVYSLVVPDEWSSEVQRPEWQPFFIP